jgi:serine/threonine protein kinase
MAGTFGQVWLVSRETADVEQRAYALKIQSKYELCKSGQAKAVVREKNVMMRLHHPLICRLFGAFQVSQSFIDSSVLRFSQRAFSVFVIFSFRISSGRFMCSR